MMLMTKFGKFKLRLIATINMSVLLSLFNIAATSSSYWVKYLDGETGVNHFAGLWRSCRAEQQAGQGWPCGWKSGIVHHTISFWSLFVRLFLTVGTLLNIIVVFFYLVAFICKLNKKSKCAIRFMEWANFMLVCAFCILLAGFGLFVSNSSNFSIWLFVWALIIVVITSNLVTRKFTALYFQNTRASQIAAKCESNNVTMNNPCDPEEKIALAPLANDVATETTVQTSDANTNTAVASVETKNEVNGSNEVLIPSSAAKINEKPSDNESQPSAPAVVESA